MLQYASSMDGTLIAARASAAMADPARSRPSRSSSNSADASVTGALDPASAALEYARRSMTLCRLLLRNASCVKARRSHCGSLAYTPALRPPQYTESRLLREQLSDSCWFETHRLPAFERRTYALGSIGKRCMRNWPCRQCSITQSHYVCKSPPKASALLECCIVMVAAPHA